LFEKVKAEYSDHHDELMDLFKKESESFKE